MWNSVNQFEHQMLASAFRFPTRIFLSIRDGLLTLMSQNDAVEAWISVHLIINYSLLHRLEHGDSLWMFLTMWCWPFALCILTIHIYSLIKYSPSGAIYARVLITAFLFPRFDILPNIVLAFLLQTSVANGKRRIFHAVSAFICNNNDYSYSKQTRILCSHYYLSTLYQHTKEMYRQHYLHLYSHQKIHCNYYQNNFIENLMPKIRKEMEGNLTDIPMREIALKSICISNRMYLWHIVLGYDKYWTVHYYDKNYVYYTVRFVYANLLIFGIIQYLSKLYCLMYNLRDSAANLSIAATISFILLGEFWTFGFFMFYLRKKDNNRFIVRLYQQRFMLRVLDALQIDSDYVNEKALNDIKALCRCYTKKQTVFKIIKHTFGYDLGLLVMQYAMPKWKLAVYVKPRFSDGDCITNNIKQYDVFRNA